jgi:hydrogenase-4 transcriptional activator
VIARFGDLDAKSSVPKRRFKIGEVDGRHVELEIQGFKVSDYSVLDLIDVLINSLADGQRARAERETRGTIWPESFDTANTDKAVISGHMRELMSFAQRVARTTVNVMLTGESGTGKEILARAIHDFSDRAQKPFLPLNCAAVPRELLESQLFGHRRGAFTGAERDQLGLIRSADGGTLFLDEVGEMSLELQPKLLRFLESGEIAPLGEPAPLTVKVRVIAATNANLEDAVRDGRFREDLFYRLNVVRLAIKPLRERRDEIPGLVNHFVAGAAREYKKGYLQVAEETMERLLLYRWPGNVRQLHNEIRRMVALAEPDSTLDPDAISADILGALPLLRQPAVNGHEAVVPLHEKLAPTLSRIEYEMIKAALRANDGRLEPAAKALGISRKGLYLKRQRLGL